MGVRTAGRPVVNGHLVVAALAAAAGAAVLVGLPRRRLGRLRGNTLHPSSPLRRRAGLPTAPGSAVRRRVALTGLAVAAGLLAGSAALVLGVSLAAVVVDRLLARLEPASSQDRTEQIVAALPAFADLVAAAVRAGVPPQSALGTCATAFGGPIGSEVGRVVARLELGVPAERAWTDALAVGGLTPLARAMARGTGRGTSPVAVLERCSLDARRVARAAARRRAQAVGVTAAAPLGLCFLPAFVLVAVVPMVVGGLAAFVR